MTAMLAPSGAHLLCRALAIALLAIAVGASKPAVATDLINVALDQAKVIRLPAGIATIVIGNPLIADVSIQTGGLLVITGKGYGTTNFLAYDRSGAVLLDKMIQVESPSEVVVVYRGVERESYSCAPTCERRITLGDSPAFFDTLMTQAGSRVGQAQGGAGPSVQR
jgi:Pilus formation protein N terminal region